MESRKQQETSTFFLLALGVFTAIKICLLCTLPPELPRWPLVLSIVGWLPFVVGCLLMLLAGAAGRKHE